LCVKRKYILVNFFFLVNVNEKDRANWMKIEKLIFFAIREWVIVLVTLKELREMVCINHFGWPIHSIVLTKKWFYAILKKKQGESFL